MDLKYAYTILYVDDVSLTIEFYKNAFGFEQKMLTPELDYGEIISGDTTIAFANHDLGRSNFPKGYTGSSPEQNPLGIQLSFTTLEVGRAMKKAIDCGATLLHDVVTKPWGQDTCCVRDLNGFMIEICTPISN